MASRTEKSFTTSFEHGRRITKALSCTALSLAAFGVSANTPKAQGSAGKVKAPQELAHTTPVSAKISNKKIEQAALRIERRIKHDKQNPYLTINAYFDDPEDPGDVTYDRVIRCPIPVEINGKTVLFGVEGVAGKPVVTAIPRRTDRGHSDLTDGSLLPYDPYNPSASIFKPGRGQIEIQGSIATTVMTSEGGVQLTVPVGLVEPIQIDGIPDPLNP